MQKIPTLFKKKYNDNGKYLGVIPEWNVELDPNKLYAVTVKWDGTACAIIDGELYKRYDMKPGKNIPNGAIMCQPYDKDAKHNPCWVKCDRDNPSDKWHWRAFDKGAACEFPYGQCSLPFNDGTYELIGRHIQNNPYGMIDDKLIPHGQLPTNFFMINLISVDFEYFKDIVYRHFCNEGIVIWEYDNNSNPVRPVAKLRRKDFGYKWNE